MADVTEAQIRSELETMRDRIDELVRVILTDRTPEGLMKRKVPPLQEELMSMPAPDFLDATATMLLQVTSVCSASLDDLDGNELNARVIGTYFNNLDTGDVVPDALVRGTHEMLLCFDRLRAADGESRGVAVNLANVVALARIGAQSLLDV